jgi:hypothetical protein
MGYADITVGTNGRKGSKGQLSNLKGKPTDKMNTTGKPAITNLSSNAKNTGKKK